ncbi:hypothetical protein FHW97_002610 [Novosphingobium sp. SG754]|nr:hypothetical protein [Novosphingobium sp. BK626]MBB3478006.1 hypothetical protein [Novosphingobium sp. BK369]MBB3621091.1 hypothetical protein [Novosphingobium sp. BK592]NOX06116.1 hypothetical protein [Novosphingobium sp. SG754]
MSTDDPDRRRRALSLHERLLEQGRIPLLCWHHLEELLGGDDDAKARKRISFLMALPLIAWIRLPKDEVGLGSVAQVRAAEVVAACEGLNDLIAIRDRARTLLLQTGTGRQAIGEDAWVWEAVRPMLLARKAGSDMVTALGPLRTFDESRTIGELSKGTINSPQAMRAQLGAIHAKALQEAMQSTGGDAARSRAMADEFLDRALAMLPPPGTTVRDLLVSSLVDQGLDVTEVRDECILADLSRLGVFRSQLRVIASETGRSFEALKRVPMDMLPSWVIGEALRKHGQVRTLRPGSDLHDSYLAVLAAYCEVLYVDKRTAEDFRQALKKEPRLVGLIGEIAKASDFDGIAGPPC